MYWFFIFLFLLVSSTTASFPPCNRCVHQSTAAYYYEDSPTSYGGACGYGNLALEISKGYFAAAVPSLYKGGAGCGACYQVRCKDKYLCNTAGTKIVLTDQNNDNTTDIVLSKKAFSAMALKGKAQRLLNTGRVDVEYKRIPCEYKNKNLLVQVVEWSHKPYYLAIKFLYQGGQTDIQAVNIAKVGLPKWRPMKRNYGAIWDINGVPEGGLQLRMVVTSRYDNGKWIWAGSVLPSGWKNGEIYDTGVQINDIAYEYCPPWQCGGDGQWK
ncbi:expansin-like A1 [Cucumis melo var. makuwa]|uniref:Expansin-like A1 n=2 Tax=Cucumis melo TaxID=3656 RepID=A0A5A7TA87_CUCMM|nr:expansin-like A1 [Cucumis melo]KAA0040372.1 expansin-like A1 [Cucumis melo var. makuwa]TYK23332.1 expansin-like A1 [Cucumis melo var. makuwa]